MRLRHARCAKEFLHAVCRGFLKCMAIAGSIQLAGIVGLSQAASHRTAPNAVAIENTNAALAPTDETIPQANPARPTVTIPARIPPTGYLQFEQGFVHADSSPGGTLSQTALSQTTKIALTTRLMAQFITEPFARSSVAAAGPGTLSDDPGDLDLGVQVLALKSAGVIPAVSVGYIRRVRSGTSANLDVGDSSQSVLLLLGGDLGGGFHYDSNILFNEQNAGLERRAQFGQTLAISRPILGATFQQRLGAIAELSHFTQPFPTQGSDGSRPDRANAVDLLFVATYSFRPNIIFDVSVDHGLTSTSTQWQGGFGFTYLLPHRLWPDRHPVAIPVRPF